ncbi:histidine kinase [Mesobacillus campisalis]|uniref:histidine kinase n=1 Tax=Mesobacillus campisalis TaxID=1408103 RepID=A0A0M2SJH7_9BACI|nr:HAMP domain-containing sensor histidine kinase [Mesobacillus campisalis]KKK34423.1 histidine kinase [Mesobacillus campisalis]
MEITRHFLFNLSLLLIFMFISLMWTERIGTNSIPKRTATLYYISSIFLCFAFSYNLTDTIRLDLRDVPVIIGGLYLGIGPLLAATAILTRALDGIDSGILTHILFYGLLAFSLWRLHPWFIGQKAKWRIIFAVLATFIVSFGTVVHIEWINPPHEKFDVWMAYLFIPSLGTCILAYSVEFVRKNLLMRKHLIKSKKLEVVEQMGAAISHEIRNPLTAAIGFVQLLQEDRVQPSKRKEYLSLVKGELESAEKVIQDYLTFSKPSFGAVEVLNIRRELAHVLTIVQPLANKNSVRITSDFAGVGFVEGDRQKFRQCFLNVLKNGIEAMPSGGELVVETLFTPAHVGITIKDTGIGMTKDQLDRLGEPYYSTKEGKGTGLGMMVVYSIVRAMKGTIQVESSEGEGTAFHFMFPSTRNIRKENLS